MREVLFVINPKESNELKYVYIDIYLGIKKITKQGYFSGQLIRYKNKNNEMLQEQEKIKLNNLKLNDFNKNIYLTTQINILLELLKEEKLFYLFKNKILKLNKIKIIEKCYFKFIKNKILCSNIEISKEAVIISTDFNYHYIFIKQKLFILHIKLEKDIINNILQKKLLVNQLNINRISYINESEFEILGIKKCECLIDSISPKPLLKLSVKEDFLIIEFEFEYLNKNIPWNFLEKHIILNEKSIIRNFFKEKKYIDIFEKKLNFKLIKSNKIEYSDSVMEKIKELSYLDFKILWKNSNKKISFFKTFKSSLKSGIDWLELDVKLSLTKDEIDIKNIINSIKDNEMYVTLNENEVLFLSEKVKKQIKLLKEFKDLNKIKYSEKGQLNLFLKENNSLNKKNISLINSYTPFEQLELDIPQFLKEKLYPHQIQGIQWLKYLYLNSLGGCLADDMGLGKTIQIIGLLSDEKIRKNKKKNIIIAPKTLLKNWENEIIKFNPNIKCKIIQLKKEINIKLDEELIIISYEMLRNNIECFNEEIFNCIILDEAQKIKNMNSLVRKELKHLKGKSRYLLTGTPIENSISDLYSLMDFINPNYFCFKNWENQSTIKNIISPFILRREKDTLLKKLPPKNERIININFSKDEEKLYKVLKTSFKEKVRNGNSKKIKYSTEILKDILYLRLFCLHPSLLPNDLNINNLNSSTKFEKSKEVINNFIKNKEKVVIFSQFTNVLKLFKLYFEEKKIKYNYLDGQSNNRLKIVENFNNENNLIFLISLKAGGVGINLTSASKVILYDSWWNPAVENQAIDRVYRIGQEKEVDVYRIIVNNSIESKIEQLKKLKKELSIDILKGQKKITLLKELENYILN